MDCKTVSPTNSHPSANGALLVDDGKTLMVNDVIKATTTIYAVDPVTKQLTPKQQVVSRVLGGSAVVDLLMGLCSNWAQEQTICLSYPDLKTSLYAVGLSRFATFWYSRC